MGAQAQVWGYGPYHPDLLDDLDYPPSYYDTVKEGDLIFACLLGYCTGTTASKALADQLDIEIYNPGTWVIAPYALKDALYEGENDDWLTPGEQDYWYQLNPLIRASRLGWTLFFTPNC